MYRRALTLLSVCALLPHLAEAWGPHRSADFPNPPQLSYEQQFDYPYQKSLDWSVKMTYLLVHPHEEDLDYADRLNTTVQSGVPTSTSLTLEDPSFGWWSGARIGLGRYLPNNDKWDFNIVSTYVYADNHSSTSVNTSDNQLLYTPWGADSIGADLTSASMNWRLNYFVWDLNLGRYYRLKQNFYIHPTIGLRTALIYVDYKTNYAKRFYQSSTFTPVEDKFEAKQTFWGIGPALGSDFNFGMKYNFAIIGNLSAALVYGHDTVKQSIHSHVVNGSTISPFDYHERANGTPLRTNVEAAIGIGWDKWVKNNTVYVATSFQFEVSEWFSMNSFFNTSEAQRSNLNSNVAIGELQRHHGNLGYYGFSFNVQVDF